MTAMRRPLRLWWIPFLLLFLPLFGRVPAHPDLPGYFAPIREWTAASVLRGTVPLLNPLNGCGEPWFANPQTAPLGPQSWPWLLLPAPWALTAEIALHLAWLALGAGILARRLGADRVTTAAAEAAAFLAPPVLTLTGVLNNLETLAWAPWIVLASRTRRPELTLPVAVAAGWFGAAPVLWALILAAALLTSPRRTRAAAGIVLGIGLAAVQIGPFLGWVAGGDRGRSAVPEAMVAAAVPPEGWLSLVVPGAVASAWAGTVFLGGALLAAAAGAVRRFPGIAAAAVALAGLATLPAVGGGALFLALTSGLVRYPARFAAAAGLLVLVLALAGLAPWVRGEGRAATAVAGGLTLLLAGRVPDTGTVGTAVLGGLLLAAAVWPGRRGLRWAALGVTAVLFVGLGIGELRPRPVDVLHPRGWEEARRPGRIWSPLPGPGQRRFLARNPGAMPLWPVGYTNLLTGVRRVGTEAPVTLAAVSRLERDASTGPAARWSVDSAAGRWIVLRRPSRTGGLVPVARREGLWLHENPHAWPLVVATREVITDGMKPRPVPGLVAFALREETVTVHTLLDGAGVVVASLAPLPGWAWRLDGRPITSFRGPSVLQQVQVPPGPHRLEGRYTDPLLKPGAVVSALSAMMILGIAFGPERPERRT